MVVKKTTRHKEKRLHKGGVGPWMLSTAGRMGKILSFHEAADTASSQKKAAPCD